MKAFNFQIEHYQGGTIVLKTAKYRNWGFPASGPEFGEVVYAVINNHCYFSGNQRSDQVTSTINAAESIITAIAKQEGVDVFALTYFDLQTHRGYYWPCGLYELSLLIIDPGETDTIHIVDWRPAICPPEVYLLFQEYITTPGTPIKIWLPAEAQKAGYEPSKMFSNNAMQCLHFIESARDLNRSINQVDKIAPEIAQIIRRSSPSERLLEMILVDHLGNAESWKRSEGNRYCIWLRQPNIEN